MNNKVPFYNSQGGQLFRMGDSISQPNFQHVYSLYSYLIKCCLTKGITAVKHYSPYSVFQEENKSIMLPEDNIAGFLTPECIEEIVEVSLTCSEAQNQSVEEIIGHLSWGDIKVSQFFLKEFIKHIRIKKGQINILQALMNPIKAILKLDDSKVLKKQRMDFILNFGENIMSHQYISEYQYQQIRNSSMSSYNLGLVNFLFKVKDQYPIYLLIILNFIGKLATTDHKDQIIKEKLVEIKAYFQDWVWIFLHRIVDDSLLASRAKSKFNIQLVILAEQTILSFAEIFDIKDLLNQSSQENQNQVQINIMQTQNQIDILKIYNQKQNNQQEEVSNVKNLSDEKIKQNQNNINQDSQIFEYYENDGEEESIFKLITDEKQESQQSFVSLNNQINENPRIATHKGNSFEVENHIEENQNDYLDQEHII